MNKDPRNFLDIAFIEKEVKNLIGSDSGSERSSTSGSFVFEDPMTAPYSKYLVDSISQKKEFYSKNIQLLRGELETERRIRSELENKQSEMERKLIHLQDKYSKISLELTESQLAASVEHSSAKKKLLDLEKQLSECFNQSFLASKMMDKIICNHSLSSVRSNVEVSNSENKVSLLYLPDKICLVSVKLLYRSLRRHMWTIVRKSFLKWRSQSNILTAVLAQRLELKAQYEQMLDDNLSAIKEDNGKQIASMTANFDEVERLLQLKCARYLNSLETFASIIGNVQKLPLTRFESIVLAQNQPVNPVLNQCFQLWCSKMCKSMVSKVLSLQKESKAKDIEYTNNLELEKCIAIAHTKREFAVQRIVTIQNTLSLTNDRNVLSRYFYNWYRCISQNKYNKSVESYELQLVNVNQLLVKHTQYTQELEEKLLMNMDCVKDYEDNVYKQEQWFSKLYKRKMLENSWCNWLHYLNGKKMSLLECKVNNFPNLRRIAKLPA